MDRLPIVQMLRRYLWVDGRSSRLEWWLVHLGCAAAVAINDHLLIQTFKPGGTLNISGFWLLTTFAALWMSFASIVRRLHDRGKSAWWTLLYLFPVFGWAWLIVECGFLPGRGSAPAASSAPPAAPQVGTVRRVERRPWNWGGIGRRTAVIAAVILVALYELVWIPISQNMAALERQSQAPSKPHPGAR